MRYISLFSGIEAASVAFEPLGWLPVAFAEIDPFACAVLAHHWPTVPNLGDMQVVDWSQYAGIDVVIGGPPCQAFSVAGLRRSLDDDRGNLSLAYVRAIHALQPAYAITENVPGWLSTKDNAFGCFLGGLVGADAPLVPPAQSGGRWTDAGMVIGPLRTAAWRILDAQYFKLAQRRRRVFVVSCPRNGTNPCAVLFERTSLSGHPAPRRETGQDVAGSIGQRINRSHTELDGHGAYVPISIQHAMIGRKPESGPQGPGWRDDGLAFTLDSRADTDAVLAPMAFAQNTRDEPHLIAGDGSIAGALAAEPGMKQQTYIAFSAGQSSKAGSLGAHENQSPTLRGAASGTNQVPAVLYQDSQYGVGEYDTAGAIRAGRIPEHQMVPAGMAVRRLTPRECERLQGFEDDHTLVPYHGKLAADGPRYRSIGNSMAVPCIRWLGERIAMVDDL